MATQLESTQCPVQIRTEFTAGRSRRCRRRSDYHRAVDRQSSVPVGHQVPQPAADPVGAPRECRRPYSRRNPPGRVLTGLDGHRVRGLGVPIGRQGMHDQPGPPNATSPGKPPSRTLTAGESAAAGSTASRRSGRQLGATLARQAPSIAQPARLRIRSRNPSVFAQQQLLGSKVRFLAHGRSRGFSQRGFQQVSVSRLRCALAGVARRRRPPQQETLQKHTIRPASPNKGARPCRSAISLPPGDSCPDELLWQAATLVSVALLLWRGGT